MRCLYWFTFSLSVAVGGGAACGAEVFVSPFGNDAAAGTRAAPFATLEHAREAARRSRAAGQSATVTLLPGRYERAKTLVLGMEDSGVTWRGQKGAVVTGGEPIGGWREEGNGVWSAEIPGLREGTRYFEQLFVNGRRAIRARWPHAQHDWRPGTNRTDLLIAEGARTIVTTNAAGAVRYEDRLAARPGDLDCLTNVTKSEWKYVSILVLHHWQFSRRAVLGYDPATREVITCGQPQKPWCHWQQGSAYYLENLRPAFAEPGEWFLDVAAGKVFYRPRAGERMGSARIEAPRNGMGQLLVMDGCRDVRFECVDFECTDSPRRAREMGSASILAALDTSLDRPGPTQYEGEQASFFSAAAIQVDRSYGCVFTNCAVRNTGEYGLWVRHACESNRLERCRFEDNGAGGIRLGDTSGTEISRFNVIRNCLVTHGGRFHPSGVGIWIGEPQDSRVVHNHIADYYYSGLSMGWNWGVGGVGFRNEVCDNLIENIGQRMLADLGGIYTLGLQTGTRIERNVVRNMDTTEQGGRGLYMDQGSSGITAVNNLVEHTLDSLFCFHFGRDNVISNNIFAFAEKWHAADIGIVDPVQVLTFVNNIIYWDSEAPEGFRIYSYRKGPRRPDSLAFDRNIWWRTRGAPLFSEEGSRDKPKLRETFAQRQARGLDVHSVVEDPQFVNPRSGDYRFKSDAVIRKTGFIPFDVSSAGIEKE